MNNWAKGKQNQLLEAGRSGTDSVKERKERSGLPGRGTVEDSWLARQHKESEQSEMTGDRCVSTVLAS